MAPPNPSVEIAFLISKLPALNLSMSLTLKPSLSFKSIVDFVPSSARTPFTVNEPSPITPKLLCTVYTSSADSKLYSLSPAV